MLLLSRVVGEKVMIGDDIVVSVTKIQDGQVQLGITAPQDVMVDREEIRMRKNAGLRAPQISGNR